MAITDTWDASFEAAPSGTDDIADGDNRIRELKRAIRERKEKSHYIRDTNNIYGDGLIPDEEGRNIPGNTPAVFIGTLAAINALTGLEARHGGELAFDTDSGVLRVYDGTVWTTHTISEGVLGGPLLTLDGSGDGTGDDFTVTGWNVNPTTFANMLDESDGTITTDGTHTGGLVSASIYVDLGAVKIGTLRLSIDLKTNINASNVTSIATQWAFDDPLLITDQRFNLSFQGVETCKSASITVRKYNSIIPFWGRYVGFNAFSTGSSPIGTIGIRRFEVNAISD